MQSPASTGRPTGLVVSLHLRPGFLPQPLEQLRSGPLWHGHPPRSAPEFVLGLGLGGPGIDSDTGPVLELELVEPEPELEPVEPVELAGPVEPEPEPGLELELVGPDDSKHAAGRDGLVSETAANVFPAG